jgi:hypothetical protein
MYTSGKFLIIEIGHVAMSCQLKLTAMTKIVDRKVYKDFNRRNFLKNKKMNVEIFIESKNIFNHFLINVLVTFVKR